MVAAALYNVNNDWKKNPDGFTPDDFMPGAQRKLSEEEQMREFILAVERGEDFKPDPKQLERFVAGIKGSFKMKTEPRPEIILTDAG